MKKTLPQIWRKLQKDLLAKRMSREFYFKTFGAKELKKNERRRKPSLRIASKISTKQITCAKINANAITANLKLWPIFKKKQ